MRRILAMLALLSLVIGLGGCASESKQGAGPNTSSNANSAVDTKAAPAPMPVQNANRAANTSAPSQTVGGGAPTGIKPPMKNEK